MKYAAVLAITCVLCGTAIILFGPSHAYSMGQGMVFGPLILVFTYGLLFSM